LVWTVRGGRRILPGPAPPWRRTSGTFVAGNRRRALIFLWPCLPVRAFADQSGAGPRAPSLRGVTLARLASRERLSFAKLREVLQLPDLIAVQRESFQWFLDEGVAEVLRDISPIEDFTGQLKLELADHVFDPPKHSEQECRERDMTYARPLFVTARFMNSATGEIKEQTVFMGDFPMMTD